MKRAVLSDIHSNLEAFKAVLKDIEIEKVDEIYCLGDLVGYGPNPLECLDLMMSDPRRKVCLLGNHDQATLFDPSGFNPTAEKAIFWTRNQIEQRHDNRAQERWSFLGELPRIHREDSFLFVHGSPRSPLNEYVFGDDIMDKQKMEKLFAIVPKYCFQGHTHVPGIFTDDCRYHRMQDLPGGIMKLDSQDPKKMMINVGSVGQPRDKDPRACYVILDLDNNTIEYRRIPYDAVFTCQKIFEIDELDNFLGERIKQGR